MSEMKLDLDFGLDGISFVFLVLTVLIFPFCVLAS
jgi:NADH:ubiquinone oxidoreductase subunit 4 (subunit M)